MVQNNSRLRPVEAKQDRWCVGCEARGACMVAEMDDAAGAAFRGAIRVRGPYEPGEYLYRRGTPMSAIYFVNKGLVRTETVSEDGGRFIGEFVHSGELLAVDAMHRGSHPADAIAIQRTWVCELPLTRLEALGDRHPALLRALLKRMSRRLDAGTMGAVERRAMLSHERIQAFVLDLYQRAGGHRGVASTRMCLPMAKGDIATYLGLTPESFSRGLRKLEDGGMIRNFPRHIELTAKLLAAARFDGGEYACDAGRNRPAEVA